MSTNRIKSGIYAIRHSSGCVYVGSAHYIKARFSRHKTHLTSGSHCNQKLQRAWDKYGPDAFTFSVLEYVEDLTLLIAREQFWIDQNLDNMYNICLFAGNARGRKHSEESREKVRVARAGKKFSPEHLANLSAAHVGVKLTPEHCKKLSLARTGKRLSASHAANIAAGQRGKKHSLASRLKMSESAKNRQLSAEHRAAALANLEKGRRACKGMKRPPISEEHRAKLSAAAKLHHAKRRAMTAAS